MIPSLFSSIFLLKPFLFIFNLVFSYQDILLKIGLILTLLELYILLLFGNDFKFNKLSKLRHYYENELFKYKILSKKELYFVTSYVLLYISIFILGILYLRIQNQNHEINLVEQYEKIRERISQSTITNNILSLVLILIFLITIITVYKRLFNSFKFFLKKLHIYLHQYEWYDAVFFNTSSEKYPSYLLKLNTYTRFGIYSSLHDGLNDLAYLLKVGKPRLTWTEDERTTWDHLHHHMTASLWKHSYHFHYIILSITLVFDLLFNNLTLKSYFFLLPFFFIYHTWIRFSNTIDLMGHGPSHDLMALFYKNCYKDNDVVYSENGDFLCTIPEGLKNLRSYAENFTFPETHENYFPPKGIFLTTLEKPLIRAFSSKFGQNIIKYNYRRQMIKIHKILTLQIKK